MIRASDAASPEVSLCEQSGPGGCRPRSPVSSLVFPDTSQQYLSHLPGPSFLLNVLSSPGSGVACCPHPPASLFAPHQWLADFSFSPPEPFLQQRPLLGHPF